PRERYLPEALDPRRTEGLPTDGRRCLPPPCRFLGEQPSSRLPVPAELELMPKRAPGPESRSRPRSCAFSLTPCCEQSYSCAYPRTFVSDGFRLRSLARVSRRAF